ncbi:MAG: MerR family transcriptional regulator [Synechococcaceae cyanobacterium SM2_3_1]|nr:MerR family transcriptional regulator [Synechococcaceae cyanobacterium SM2_3_1]
MTSQHLTIKDLTHAVGGSVSPRMVRHYHQIGLMPQPKRSRGNYRLYTSEDVSRLKRIIALKEQGFQLSHIQQLLEHDPTHLSPETLTHYLQQQYTAIMQQIARLRQTAHALEGLLVQDQDCQLMQADILAQLRWLDVEVKENLGELDQLWQQLDAEVHTHPQAYSESLDRLLPDMADRSEIEKDLICDLVMACGDASIVSMLQLGHGAISAARLSLLMGRPVITDVPAIAAALDQTRLAHLECPVQVLIEDPHVSTVAEAEQAFWQQLHPNESLPIPSQSIVVVGFAPSVLMALCAAIEQGQIHPALIIGLPIGFTHAPAAKRLLRRSNVPYLTINGSLGGGLLAATALNSLIKTLIEKPHCHCFLSR